MGKKTKNPAKILARDARNHRAGKITIGDKHMRDKKGFDDKSFKTPPTKRR